MRGQTLLIAAMCSVTAMAGSIKYNGVGRPALCLAIDEPESPISEIVLDRCDGSAEQQWLDKAENFQIQAATIPNRCLHAGPARNVTFPRFDRRNYAAPAAVRTNRGLIAAGCLLAKPASSSVKPRPIDAQAFELLDVGAIRWRGGLSVISNSSTSYCVEVVGPRFSTKLSIQPCVAGKSTQSFEFLSLPYDE